VRHSGQLSTIDGAGPSDHQRWAHDGDAFDDVASVHPAAPAPDEQPPFRVFVDGDRLVLTGCVDTFQAEQLAQALARWSTTPAVVLDVSRLEFVDVAGCRVIARWAGELSARGVPVEIRDASRLFRRIWQVLSLGGVASVTFTEESA
jgi:anti-anti-sigma regulatory factor